MRRESDELIVQTKDEGGRWRRTGVGYNDKDKAEARRSILAARGYEVRVMRRIWYTELWPV